MFHVEVRQFPQVARVFNLSRAELEAQVLTPWARGEPFKLAEQEWEPRKANLTVLEGREMHTGELGLGRGWSNAARGAEDVTARVLAAARGAAEPGGATASTDPGRARLTAFKDVVRAQCASHHLAVHQVMWLAGSRHPELRVSERLGLAELAVWELLHQGALTLVSGAPDGELAPVERGEWQTVLLAWATWCEPPEPRWFLASAE